MSNDNATSQGGLLGYAEASQLLGIKLGTLYSMVHERRIPFYRLSGRMVRFRRADLERWLAERAVEPTS
jgi:excisionase family DNA binding protein